MMKRQRAYLVDGVIYARGLRPTPIYAIRPKLLGENCVFVSPTDGKEFEIVVREKLPAGLEPTSDVVPSDSLAVPGDEEADALSPEGEPEVDGKTGDELEPPAAEVEGSEEEEAKESEAEEEEEKKKEKEEAFTRALAIVQEGGDPLEALAQYAECGGMGGLTIVISPGGGVSMGGSPDEMGDEMGMDDEGWDDDVEPMGDDEGEEIPAEGDVDVEDTLGNEYPEDEMESL